MRKYRVQPPRAVRFRSNDAWDEDYNLMDRSITVYEADNHWQEIAILHPDTGKPIEVYTGPDPIGFVHFEDEE